MPPPISRIVAPPIPRAISRSAIVRVSRVRPFRRYRRARDAARPASKTPLRPLGSQQDVTGRTLDFASISRRDAHDPHGKSLPLPPPAPASALAVRRRLVRAARRVGRALLRDPALSADEIGRASCRERDSL